MTCCKILSRSDELLYFPHYVFGSVSQYYIISKATFIALTWSAVAQLPISH
jgi:hypothetical protein